MILMNTSELSTINPFFVMEILEEAQQLEKKGMKIVHLEIGEPIEKVDHRIISFAKKALDRNKDKYTNSLGLIELRLLISKYYKNNFNLSIDPNRIILTLGSSGAIILSILSSTNYGDEIIIVKPHYPCYPQIIKILGRKVKFFETFEKDNYQINFKKLSNSITKKTKALIINSPSNPTSISQSEEILKKISGLKIQVISDEIYQGLSISNKISSIFKYNSTKTIVVNGFSKLYSMTGWRLGYCILPKKIIRVGQKLQQNMFICAPTLSQHAATKAFSIPEKNKNVLLMSYKKKRDYLIKNLNKMGINIDYYPDSAFYIFCDFSKFTNNSLMFCKEILNKTGLALAPGIDFGDNYKNFVRISYAGSFSDLRKGVKLLSNFLMKYNV